MWLTISWNISRHTTRPSSPDTEGRTRFDGTEAQSLWHQRVRERLAGQLGLTELRCARAVFVKHDAGGKLKLILTPHVDDGYCLGQDLIQSIGEKNDQHSA